MWIFLFTASLALFYGYRRSHRPEGGFEINHVSTFTFAFLFYWLMPMLLVTALPPQFSSSVMDYFNDISSDRILGFQFSLILLYTAFALGDTLGAYPIFRTRRPQRSKRPFQPKLWRVAWAFVFLVFLIELFQARGQLFADYESADMIQRGTVIAVLVVLFSISLRMSLAGHWLLMKIYLIVSLASLALGGRLYVVSAILSLLAYASHKRPLRARTLILGAVGGMVAMGTIGLLRLHSAASLLLIFINVGTESLYTSFSLFSYLGHNPIAWFHLPVYLAADFFNLIPSFLVDKHNMQGLTSAGLGIESPLGALNSWVSFNVNFGLVGTAVVLFLFGYLMRRYQEMSVSYLMLTGFTGFTFFRDPFSVSIVKTMIEFSLLVPFLMDQMTRLAVHASPPSRTARVGYRWKFRFLPSAFYSRRT